MLYALFDISDCKYKHPSDRKVGINRTAFASLIAFAILKLFSLLNDRFRKRRVDIRPPWTVTETLEAPIEEWDHFLKMELIVSRHILQLPVNRL